MRAYHVRKQTAVAPRVRAKAAPRLSILASSLAFAGIVAVIISLALRGLT